MLTLDEALEEAGEAGAVSLPFARYRFLMKVTAPVLLQDYAGSAIRGAFGRSLRRTACMTHQRDCKGCPLYRTCPYTAVFETPPPEDHALQKFSQIPNAYVIEPPQWGSRVMNPGDAFSFDMVLFGRAREHLALLIYAVDKAFRFNIGGGKAELQSVEIVRTGGQVEEVYSPILTRTKDHDNNTVVAVPKGGRLTLTVETPLRLQNNGVPLRGDEITPHVLLSTLMRRISLLMEFQAGSALQVDHRSLAALSDEVVIEKHNLRWCDWTRYSTRQKRRMTLGGVVGTMTLANVPPVFRVLLAVGELTHLGKNATFGLGKYEIEASALQ